MPGPTIDQAFITQFNRDVYLAYQITESKFRNMVRTDAEVLGDRVRFQKLGTLTVTSKARNGNIPIQNPAHSFVDLIMLDRYAAVLIDQLDLTKLNIAVREGYIYNMAAAFARESDQEIIAAMLAGATQTVTPTNLITRNATLSARELLDVAKVPSDGRVYCAVTPHAWATLMTISEFANEQFVGYEGQPWKMQGPPMKYWNRCFWFQYPELPGTGTATASCFMWHYRCIGHGTGQEMSITWDWENLMKGWSGAGSMSMNAIVIDATGIVKIVVNDTTAIP
jgi:hypothetical protein